MVYEKLGKPNSPSIYYTTYSINTYNNIYRAVDKPKEKFFFAKTLLFLISRIEGI